MMELAFDIASGANFKFNTAFTGEEVCPSTIQLIHHFNKILRLFLCT